MRQPRRAAFHASLQASPRRSCPPRPRGIPMASHLVVPTGKPRHNSAWRSSRSLALIVGHAHAVHCMAGPVPERQRIGASSHKPGWPCARRARDNVRGCSSTLLCSADRVAAGASYFVVPDNRAPQRRCRCDLTPGGEFAFRCTVNAGWRSGIACFHPPGRRGPDGQQRGPTARGRRGFQNRAAAMLRFLQPAISTANGSSERRDMARAYHTLGCV